MEITNEEKLKVYKEKRAFVAKAFKITLGKLLSNEEPISEVMLKEEWLKEIRKDKSLSHDGWYMPPPNGVAILFGTDEEGEKNRISFKSIRPKELWARDDIILDRKKGMIVAYASPVDLKTGVIIDFGVTLYLGQNKKMKEYLKLGYSLTKKIFDDVRVGMKLKEVFFIGKKIVKVSGLQSEHLSITDTLALTNIGHTIPVSYEQWTNNELEIIQSGDWEKAKNLISSKRKFVNNAEELKILPGFAFTIEPRPENEADKFYPQVFFHAICLIHENSEKELVENYKEIFKLAGMSYML